MLRISRLTDYGTGVLAYLGAADKTPHSATQVAQHTGVPEATVRKVLKLLTRGGLVASQRGAQGGYRLSRPASEITAAEVINALEGPLALTECAVDRGHCELQDSCRVGTAWRHINRAIRVALEDLSLADLADGRTSDRVRIDFKPLVAPPHRTTRIGGQLKKTAEV